MQMEHTSDASCLCLAIARGRHVRATDGISSHITDLQLCPCGSRGFTGADSSIVVAVCQILVQWS